MTTAIAQLQRPDTIVLVGYFVLMLGIGAYFYRHMRGMRDYFSGGNRIPWWLSGSSFYMSSFSVAAFVQYSALAYKYGWVSVTLYWVTVPAMLASVLLFARRWRRARINSPVEYLEERYNPAVRQVFAWQGIPVTIIDDALKLIAIGMFISPLLGWTQNQSMIAAGLIMLLYTCMGGLWAVIITDFVQFVIMGAAVVVLIPLALAKTGGLTGFMDGAPDGFFHLTHPEYNWIYIGCNILLFTLAVSTRWSLVQRYYCVPRERDAFKVGIMVIVLNVVGPPLMFLPAMAAKQFLPDLEGGDVYAQLCLTLLPVGMLGLVLAAMFSATMSMLSSDYNACASVLTNDVYRRLIRPDASQRHLVWMGRAMTLTIGVIALGIALAIGDVGGEGLFRSMIKLFSVATAPVAIPMIAGLLTARVKQVEALAGFIGGVLVGIVLFILWPDSVSVGDTVIKKENVILISTIVSTLACMMVARRVTSPTVSETERVQRFMDRLAVPIGSLDSDVQPADRVGMISPFRVVGVSMVLIGGLVLGVLGYVADDLSRRLNLGIGITLIVIGGAMIGISFLGRSNRSQEKST